MEARDLLVAMKLAQWEEAKGKLRALVALQGSMPSGDPSTMRRFEELGLKVEAFITEIEDEALHE
jgi:hypothetical protein